MKDLIFMGVVAVLWTIWRNGNDVGFSNNMIFDPFVFVHLVAHSLRSWSVMQRNYEKANFMIWGTRMFEQVKNKVFRANKGWRPRIRTIRLMSVLGSP